jgi:hypothetical protein
MPDETWKPAELSAEMPDYNVTIGPVTSMRGEEFLDFLYGNGCIDQEMREALRRRNPEDA